MGRKDLAWSGSVPCGAINKTVVLNGVMGLISVGMWLAGFAIAQTPIIPSAEASTDSPSPSLQSVDSSVANQQLSQLPRAASGTQIALNGRTLSVPWRQWQTPNGNRLGITDAGLMQGFGVRLLNTNNVAIQPVQWFSAENQRPLNLSTDLGGAYRYLDLTTLSSQFGWQVQINGSTLQITTPAAQVMDIRQGQQAWGDRLVIQLDQATPWQTSERSNEIWLTLDARPTPELLKQFQSKAGRYLQSIQLEPQANQTRIRLRLTAPVRPRVWSLSAPNRVVVDLRPDSLVEHDILWAPGVRWRQQILSVGNIRVPAVWLEVNPRQTGVSLSPMPANPTSMTGIAPLFQIAQQAQVAGAINGGFFNRDRQLPLGAIRRDGRWLSGPILNRGAIAWDRAGTFRFARLTLQETITNQAGQQFALTHLNSGYLQAGIARYTADWGATYTPLSNGEIIITVQNHQVISQQTVEQAGSTALPIPSNGYLLVLRSNRSAAAAFPVGTVVKVEGTTTPPDFMAQPNILGAGPLLIQNRQIVLDTKAESFSNAFALQRAARSAIAQKPDQSLLIVALHKNLDGVGLTLQETAQLLQQLGAVHALNLDGGSSTSLYLGGQILDQTLQTTARVHNGLGLTIIPQP